MAGRQTSTPAPASRQSLAATHPSMYSQPATKTMPPPPPPKLQKPVQALRRLETTKTNQYVVNRQGGYPTPSPSPPAPAQDSPPAKHFSLPSHAQFSQTTAMKQSRSKWAQSEVTRQQSKMPWLEHTDPTFTTSDKPPFWSRNSTVLKSDTDVTHGSTESPTFMIGLPFGSMTEAAHHYPSQERLERVA